MGRKPKSVSEKADEKRHLEQLGKHLKELREVKNLTPQNLADKLGVTPQYIYMIESGRAKPSETRLNELARALGDLADEFLATAVTYVEDEFATKLREAGLSPDEIEEAAHRVSARAKGDVVPGEKPLRVGQGLAPEQEPIGAFEGREENHVQVNRSLSDDTSAYNYAKSLKGAFKSNAPLSAGAGKHSPNFAQGAKFKVKAGSDATIVVNRPITREQREVLEDIGKVIEHVLKE